MAQPQSKEKPIVFTISRTFNAPRERVWKAWTEKEQSSQWFGPKGCTISYKTFDVRPGGVAHYCVTFNGNSMWGKWAYKELKAPEKQVAIVSFTDETGTKILPHPGMPGWPREMLSTIHFNAKSNQTEVVVQWEPYNPTPEERSVFDNNQASMEGGWSGSFDMLAEFLAKHS